MQSNSKYTKWEHFIPRVYLKGFSNIEQRKQKEKLLAWAVDGISIAPIEKQIDIEDFCAMDNLYELKNEKGEFIARNFIERTFGRLEAKVGSVLKKINEKSQTEKCLKCTSVLSEDDKSILIILMTMLQFRNPETIDYILQNKDRVKILTDPLSFGPRKEWQDKAHTMRAKRLIREFNR